MQLHARSPVDVRRAYGGERPVISKALALFGSAALRLRRLAPNERFDAMARDALTKLDADRRAGDVAWGYPWDTQTRWSFYPRGQPNVIATAFGARALSEGGEELDAPAFTERARAAAEWASTTLYLPDRGFFAYHPESDVLVHNASLLAARLVRALAPGEAAAEQARTALERTLEAQRPDGAWPYGDGMAFVDSFHTGYVLDCLCDLRDLDPAVDEAIARGAAYYAERFFAPDGSARLWPDKPYPVDAHSAGTALSSLSTLVRLGHADRDLLRRVAERTATDTVRGGHAVHRRYRWGRTTVRYVRWCDGHVALGLADAAGVLSGQNWSVSALSG
jgi:hypothetical protein